MEKCFDVFSFKAVTPLMVNKYTNIFMFCWVRELANIIALYVTTCFK